MDDKYKSSRLLYIIEAAVEYFIAILVGSTYLAKLTTSIGVSDGVTGILTSFISLGFGFQIFSLFIADKRPIKRIVIGLHLINELGFVLLYLTPIVNVSKTAKVAVFIFLLLMAEIVRNILYSPKMTWLMGLVSDSQRGSFTAKKEIISLISGMMVSFAMGAVIDSFEAKGKINVAFAVGATTMLVMTAIHITLLIFIKEKPLEIKKEPISKLLKTSLLDKNLLKLIPLFALLNISIYITTPFYGTYQINDLGFSMTQISIIAAAGAAIRSLFSVPMGKLADKRSFTAMFSVCLMFLALAFLSNTFFGKPFFIAYSMLYAVAYAGINSATVNLIYDFVPEERRTGALAIKNTVVGFVGFGATLVARPLLDTVQKNQNTLFGISIHAQQVLSIISVFFLICAIIYLNTTIRQINKRKEIKDNG